MSQKMAILKSMRISESKNVTNNDTNAAAEPGHCTERGQRQLCSVRMLWAARVGSFAEMI